MDHKRSRLGNNVEKVVDHDKSGQHELAEKGACPSTKRMYCIVYSNNTITQLSLSEDKKKRLRTKLGIAYFVATEQMAFSYFSVYYQQ